MEQCKTCKHWKINDGRSNNLIFPHLPPDYNRVKDEAEETKVYGYRLRHCTHPKILFYQRPAIDGAAVMDGSEYHAELLTAEEFGCVLHEKE